MTQPEPVHRTNSPPLGGRIRAHRHLRRISLRTLAKLTGTSPSFISQLERGQTGVSLANIVQIADALGVSVGAFFDYADGPRPAVLRRGDRPTLSTDNGVHKTLITRRPSDSMEVYCGELDIDASTGGAGYTHGDSQEVVIVIHGTVQLALGDEQILMSEGDSLEYRTSVPHGVRNVGARPAEVLWIVSPPTSSGGTSHAPLLIPLADLEENTPTDGPAHGN